MGFELMGWWGGVEVKVILVRLNNLFTVFKWAVLYKWVLCSWGFLFTKPFPPKRDYLLGHRCYRCLQWYNARTVLQVSVLAFGSSAVELSGPGRLIGSLLWSPAEIWVIFLEKELWQLGRLFYPSFHANPQSWVASEEKRFNVVHQEAEGPDVTAHAMLRYQELLFLRECPWNLSGSSTGARLC